MFSWLKNEILDLVKTMKEMNDLLKSDKIESFIVVWILFFLGIFLLTILFNNRLKLNEVGDAMGGIFGSLISTFVFIFVVHSYRLQKEELKATRNEMKNSSIALKEQVELTKQSEYRNQILSIFDLANKHIENFIYSEKYGNIGLNNFVDHYYNYFNNSESIYNGFFKSGYYSALHLYFETMFYLEKYISSLPDNNSEFKEEIFALLNSQISPNLRNSYNILNSIKIAYEKNEYKAFKRLFTYSPPVDGGIIRRL